jgi:hypothetical protein
VEPTAFVFKVDLNVGNYLQDYTVSKLQITLEMKINVCWDAAPCSLVEIDRRFRGAYPCENLKSHALEIFTAVKILYLSYDEI